MLSFVYTEAIESLLERGTRGSHDQPQNAKLISSRCKFAYKVCVFFFASAFHAYSTSTVLYVGNTVCMPLVFGNKGPTKHTISRFVI